MWLLAQLLTEITGKPRYFPKAQWSNDLWTPNLFRVYEQIFGRRLGIRAELSSAYAQHNGREELHFAFHTLESVIAYFEVWVRGKVPRLTPVRVWIPMLQTPLGPVFVSPYLFAIAFDTATISFNNGGNVSYSHTITGADPFIFVGSELNNMTFSSVTVGGNATTQIDNQTVTGGTFTRVGTFFQAAPGTGAKTVAVTVSGSANNYVGAMSYSGVDQSTPLDNHITGAASGVTTLTTTVTVNTANSWLIAYAGYTNVNSSGNTGLAGTGTVQRIIGPNANDPSPWYGLFDSNAALGTGSRALVINRTDSGQITTNLASIKPFSAATTSSVFRALLGVGI